MPVHAKKSSLRGTVGPFLFQVWYAGCGCFATNINFELPIGGKDNKKTIINPLLAGRGTQCPLIRKKGLWGDRLYLCVPFLC